MVEKNPETDIRQYPKRPLFMDGFGYNTLFIGGVESRDMNGREMVTITVKTDEVVRKQYNLDRTKVDADGYFKFIIHKVDLIPLNQFDESNRKWMYIKSFSGDETDVSRRDADLRKRLEYAQKRIMIMDSQVLRLSERLELAKTNPAKFLKESMEVHESSIKTVAEAMMKKDKE